MKIKFNIKEQVNHILACLVLVQMINPIFPNVYMLGATLLLWYLSAASICKYKLLHVFCVRCSLCVWLWPIVMFHYYIIGHMDFSFSQLIIILSAFLFPFYAGINDVRACKMISIVGVAYIMLICLFSLQAYKEYPTISRILSYGDDSLIAAQGGLAYKNAWIAGYKNIYILAFFSIAALSVVCFIRSKKIKAINVTLLAIFLYTIVRAQFTICVFLTAFGIVGFIIIKGKKKNNILMKLFIIIGIAIVGMPLMPDILYMLAKVFGGSIALHLNDLVNYSGHNYGYGLTYERINMYIISINSFINNPIIGVGRNGELYSDIGNHSSILDLFARTGIVGGGSYLFGLIGISILVHRLLNSYFSKIYKWIFAVFVISSCFNVMFNYQTFSTLYILVPCYFYSIIQLEKPIDITSYDSSYELAAISYDNSLMVTAKGYYK